MKKIESLDVSVAILAGVSCLFMFLSIPVWALFVGWAWYFALGSRPELIKKCIPPLIAGNVLAAVTFLLIDLFGKAMPSMPATIIAVVITVFLLMMTLKLPGFGLSLISFNAYSCLFVGYGAGEYMVISGMPPLLNAMIWVGIGNFIGVIFGWFSILVTQAGKKNADTAG